MTPIALDGSVVTNAGPEDEGSIAVADAAWNAGDMVFAAIVNSLGGPSSVSGVTNTGDGLGTWKQITDGATPAGVNYETVDLELWAAPATGDGSGTVTITFAGDNSTCAKVFALSNVPPLNANKIEVLTANGDDEAYPDPAVTTTAGPAQLLIVSYGGLAFGDAPDTTPSGFTALSQGTGPSIYLETASNSAATTITPGSLGSLTGDGIGLTIAVAILGGLPGAPGGLTSELQGETLMLSGNVSVDTDDVEYYKLYSSSSSGGTYVYTGEAADTPDWELANPNSSTYYKFSAVNTIRLEGPLSAYYEVIPPEEFEMERATIFQGLTIAAESSLGILPDAPLPFLLPSVIAEIKLMQQNKTFKARGRKGVMGKTRAKEYTEISISGPLGYDELVFLTQGHLAVSDPATIGTSTISAQWNTTATEASADTPQTFTVQVGSSVAGAAQIPGCFVQDFSIKVNETECTFTATLVGQVCLDSINYDGEYPYLGTATEIITYPLHETGVGIYYGTDLSELTGLTKLIEFSFDSKNRWKPAFFRNPAVSSFSGIVESAFAGSGKITLEEDSTANEILAYTREDNTIGVESQTYLALQATGPTIDPTGGVDDVAIPYKAALEWPIVLVKSPSRTDKADVWSGEYDFEVANDATIGCMTAKVTSQVLALISS